MLHELKAMCIKRKLALAAENISNNHVDRLFGIYRFLPLRMDRIHVNHVCSLSVGKIIDGGGDVGKIATRWHLENDVFGWERSKTHKKNISTEDPLLNASSTQGHMIDGQGKNSMARETHRPPTPSTPRKYSGYPGYLMRALHPCYIPAPGQWIMEVCHGRCTFVTPEITARVLEIP